MKKRKVLKNKTYAHFDLRKSETEVLKYIRNPKIIEKYGFYPFILDKKDLSKFDKEKYEVSKSCGKKYKGLLKEKGRNIMFAAHSDRYIYQWYNHKFSNRYNKYVKMVGIHECATAYRNNFIKKDNIDFAKEVFKFILEQKRAYVLIGDFDSFFDKIDHKFLKKMLCKISGKNILAADEYAVFKNITKYSYFTVEDLCRIAGIKRKQIYGTKIKYDDDGKKEYIFDLDKIMSIQELKANKKYIKVNKSGIGIPQGSPISSSLANIYMVDADQHLKDIAIKYNGLYRRYSDDFIIIIPNIEEEHFKILINEIKKILKENGNPILKDEKTRVYYYENNNLINVNDSFLNIKKNTKNELEYLGFAFDGKKIRIRDKTLSKYYYRMYKKIKTIAKCHGYTKLGNRVSGKELYRLYSKFGSNEKTGNFITYTRRVKRKMRDLNGYYISYEGRFLGKLKKRYNAMMKKYSKR